MRVMAKSSHLGTDRKLSPLDGIASKHTPMNRLKEKLAHMREARAVDTHVEDDEERQAYHDAVRASSPPVIRAAPWMLISVDARAVRAVGSRSMVKQELSAFKGSMDSLRSSTDCILEQECEE